MRTSNHDESITIISHEAPNISEYDSGSGLQIKLGCIGIHVPHEGCPGIQVYTWMANQGDAHIAYGLVVAKTHYVKECAPVMSVDVSYERNGRAELGMVLMPDSVMALYKRSKNQSAVSRGLAAFGADMKELNEMFSDLEDLLRMENMNPNAGVLLYTPPMMALDFELTGAPPMEVSRDAERFFAESVAGIIEATNRLASGGDEDDALENLIRQMAASLKEAGLLRDDGTPEEESVPLGLDAKKFFADHLN